MNIFSEFACLNGIKFTWTSEAQSFLNIYMFFHEFFTKFTLKTFTLKLVKQKRKLVRFPFFLLFKLKFVKISIRGDTNENNVSLFNYNVISNGIYI